MRVNSVVACNNTPPAPPQGPTTNPLYKHVSADFDKVNFTGVRIHQKNLLGLAGLAALLLATMAQAQDPPEKADYGMDAASIIKAGQQQHAAGERDEARADNRINTGEQKKAEGTDQINTGEQKKLDAQKRREALNALREKQGLPPLSSTPTAAKR